MAQTNKCALVVTDGMEGRSLPSRFGDSPKSNLLEYVLDSVWTVADEIFVIFDKEPSLQLIENIAPFGVKVAIDRIGTSLFSRVTAGFRASSSDNCLVIASSAPFIKPNVLFHLYQSIHGFDAAVPRWRNGLTEPLLSVYSKKAFLKASSQLKRPSFASLLDNFYAVNYVDIEDLLRPLDPELHSFFKVENKASLRKARQIATAGTV
jgi:molybdopterin-guanine dinucleotide biosynthesis protein A